MQDRPLVSIVTPSLNAGEFIEDTILSVQCQDYRPIEHIVVDGGSTDNTIDVLRKHDRRIKWISEKDRGISDALNKGFDMVNGKIVSWLNADERYMKQDTLSEVVKTFQTYRNADLIYGDSVFVNEEGLILRLKCVWPRYSYRLLRYHNYLSEPAVFYRRKVVDKHRMDQDILLVMDIDFWLKVGRDHKFRYIDDIITAVMKHGKAKTVALSRNQYWTEYNRVRQKYGLRTDGFLRQYQLYAAHKLIHHLLKFWGLTRFVKLWKTDEFTVKLNLDSKLSLLRRQLLNVPKDLYIK